MKPLLTIIALATLLCGCANQGTAPASPVAADQANVTGTPLPPPVNGIYQGRSEQVKADIPGCPLAQYGTIEIGERTLLFPYTYQLIYEVPVQSDGTLHTGAGSTVLDGRLIDGHLEFDITTPECQSRFNFRRRSGF